MDDNRLGAREKHCKEEGGGALNFTNTGGKRVGVSCHSSSCGFRRQERVTQLRDIRRKTFQNFLVAYLFRGMISFSCDIFSSAVSIFLPLFIKEDVGRSLLGTFTFLHLIKAYNEWIEEITYF